VADQPRSTGAGGWVIGLAVVYLTILVATYGTHDGLTKLVISTVFAVTVLIKARDYRRRVVSTRCPHDGAELAVTWQLPRPRLDCRACGRRYAVFGPQLYEYRRP
jgi:peptide subunit release factor 1 (eRF1)